MSALARRFVLTVIAGLLLASAANVFLQNRSEISGRGIRAHDTGSLSLLVEVEGRSVRTRYSFAVMLRDLIGTGTLTAPPDVVDRFEIEGMAGMTLDEVDYDAVIDAATARRLRGRGVEGAGALQPDGEEQPFFIVASDAITVGSRYRLVLRGDVVFVVDEETLAEMRS